MSGWLRPFAFLLLLFVTADLFADNGPKHRIRQARPIRLGVSGGNNADINTDFCCSGTLGALVKDGAGIKYILSNNHVIALGNEGVTGQPIGQPGLIDVRCNLFRAEAVANLSRFVRILYNRPNKVDAAIARIISGKVTQVGRILDIGRPGSPVEAQLGMLVKKSGRTTGKTFGQVIAINTTLRVLFPNSCGDEDGKTARFVDQIVVDSTTNRPFSDSGDSGSLIVTQKATCPRPVALLFAGDEEGIAIGNRIQNVLSALRVSIVGCASASSETETQATRLDPTILKVEQIRKRNEDRLLRIPGVVGVGVGINRQSIVGYTIVVFAKEAPPDLKNAVPQQLEGFPVRLIKTRGFKAF